MQNKREIETEKVPNLIIMINQVIDRSATTLNVQMDHPNVTVDLNRKFAFFELNPQKIYINFYITSTLYAN